MKINTDRSRRLIFDTFAERYHAGRPRFRLDLVNSLCRKASLSAGAAVLEIGAGTGQLTAALLDFGLEVLALEPGPNLAGILRRSVGENGRLSVVEQTFEDYAAAGGTFRAIFAANAFHWIDPAVAYRKAALLVGVGGSMCLVWNFPILADPALQDAMNASVFVGSLVGQQRDHFRYEETLRKTLEDGRAEMTASGFFLPTWWNLQTEELTLRANEYAKMIGSLANGPVDLDELETAARRVLGNRPAVVSNYVYAVVGRH